MTECNGCGGCCDPVMLPYTMNQILATLPAHHHEPADRQFMIDHLTQLPTRREGLERRPDLKQGARTAIATGPGGDPMIVHSFFFECDFFDRDTKQCTAYDRRPPMCSGYPWYDGVIDPSAALPPECSYNADVGREPVPVTITTKDPT